MLVLLSIVLVCASNILSDIVFPGPTKSDKKVDEAQAEIPLEMILRLNTITDQNQLFREFVKDGGKPISIEPDTIEERFGAGNEPVERKALLKPKPAGCIPELKSVSLRQSDDPWVFYFPSCTRVERCGGCCSHKLLSCQPTEIEVINYEVVVAHYQNNKLSYKGTEVVTVEKHNKCKCDCIMKEENCNPLQEYRKGECRCVCTNYDAEQKCAQDNETKLWNPDSCLCECRKITDCSTGYYFSLTSCQCEAVPDASVIRNRFGNLPFDGSSLEYNTRLPNVLRRWPPAYSIDNKK